MAAATAGTRPDGYVDWLGMLESRISARPLPGPFGLPTPGGRPATAPSGGRAHRARLSLGPQPQRARARGGGTQRGSSRSRAALTLAQRPASRSSNDWGSAPLGVVQSEAQVEQYEKLLVSYEQAIRQLDKDIQHIAAERGEHLNRINAGVGGGSSSDEAKRALHAYQEKMRAARRKLQQMKQQHKEVTWRLEQSAARDIDWGATSTPAPVERGGALAGGGGQAVVGVSKAQPAAVWRPVGKANPQRSGGVRVPGRGLQGPGSHYPPPVQRLSKLESARARAHEALVTTQRQRAAELAENAAWLSHLDEEIYRASTQMHATFKGEYRVTLAHSGPEGFGMTLDTDHLGVTHVVGVDRNGPAAAAGIVLNSEVIAVAGCTLERGQGQDGLVPVTAVCGAAAVEFRLRRPVAKPALHRFTDFAEYETIGQGQAMLTVEYCAGHLYARYEWQAAQLRDALVERFPEVMVLPKPIDPHAPRNRGKSSAFEVQLCYRDCDDAQLRKVLLFSKLQRSVFPKTESLLDKVQELQNQGGWATFTPKVDFGGETLADAYDDDAYDAGLTDSLTDDGTSMLAASDLPIAVAPSPPVESATQAASALGSEEVV
jgi:hypothetical protein